MYSCGGYVLYFDTEILCYRSQFTIVQTCKQRRYSVTFNKSHTCKFEPSCVYRVIIVNACARVCVCVCVSNTCLSAGKRGIMHVELVANSSRDSWGVREYNNTMYNTLYARTHDVCDDRPFKRIRFWQTLTVFPKRTSVVRIALIMCERARVSCSLCFPP